MQEPNNNETSQENCQSTYYWLANPSPTTLSIHLTSRFCGVGTQTINSATANQMLVLVCLSVQTPHSINDNLLACITATGDHVSAFSCTFALSRSPASHDNVNTILAQEGVYTVSRNQLSIPETSVDTVGISCSLPCSQHQFAHGMCLLSFLALHISQLLAGYWKKIGKSAQGDIRP